MARGANNTYWRRTLLGTSCILKRRFHLVWLKVLDVAGECCIPSDGDGDVGHSTRDHRETWKPIHLLNNSKNDHCFLFDSTYCQTNTSPAHLEDRTQFVSRLT